MKSMESPPTTKNPSYPQHSIKEDNRRKPHTPFLPSTGCSSSMWQHRPTMSKSSVQNGHGNSALHSSSPSTSSTPRYRSAQQISIRTNHPRSKSSPKTRNRNPNLHKPSALTNYIERERQWTDRIGIEERIEGVLKRSDRPRNLNPWNALGIKISASLFEP